MTDHPESDSAHLLPTHGRLAYLQLPALDIAASARFYAGVFGWQVSPPDTGFEAPALIGQWITDRPAAPDAGALCWIWVDDIEASLARTAALGGRVVQTPTLDGGERWLATIVDPAGTTVGIVAAYEES